MKKLTEQQKIEGRKEIKAMIDEIVQQEITEAKEHFGVDITEAEVKQNIKDFLALAEDSD